MHPGPISCRTGERPTPKHIQKAAQMPQQQYISQQRPRVTWCYKLQHSVLSHWQLCAFWSGNSIERILTKTASCCTQHNARNIMLAQILQNAPAISPRYGAALGSGVSCDHRQTRLLRTGPSQNPHQARKCSRVTPSQRTRCALC